MYVCSDGGSEMCRIVLSCVHVWLTRELVALGTEVLASLSASGMSAAVSAKGLSMRGHSSAYAILTFETLHSSISQAESCLVSYCSCLVSSGLCGTLFPPAWLIGVLLRPTLGSNCC